MVLYFIQICLRLWCVVDGVCTTMLKPAAPGTSCGKHSVRAAFINLFINMVDTKTDLFCSGV